MPALPLLVVGASGWPVSRAQPAPVMRAVADLADRRDVSSVRFRACAGHCWRALSRCWPIQRAPVGGTANPCSCSRAWPSSLPPATASELRHQRILGLAWAGLLLVPAIFIPAVIGVLPWATGTGVEGRAAGWRHGPLLCRTASRGAPANRSRWSAATGQIAELIALAAPSRPSVYFAADPAHSPWVTAQDIRDKGAVIVWPTLDTNPVPPPQIKAHFPDLVPEVPRSFERPVRGRLPPLLIGWGVIRPANTPPAH